MITPAQTRASIWDGEDRGSRDDWWATRLAEHAVKGILVNSQVDRKVDTLLTSLIAALVAYGGNSARANAEESDPAARFR